MFSRHNSLWIRARTCKWRVQLKLITVLTLFILTIIYIISAHILIKSLHFHDQIGHHDWAMLPWQASCHLGTNSSSCGRSNITVLLSSFSITPIPAPLNRSFKYCAFLRHFWTSFQNPLYPFRFKVYQRKMGAWPFLLPMIVAFREARYFTFLERALMYSSLVICTPHGIVENLLPPMNEDL